MASPCGAGRAGGLAAAAAGNQPSRAARGVQYAASLAAEVPVSAVRC